MKQGVHKFRIFILLAASALALLAACNQAEQHTITITGPIHVYRTDTPPATYPGIDFVAELGPNDHPAVLETKSGSGYRAAKIRLADGREGWVFSGEPVEIR